MGPEDTKGESVAILADGSGFYGLREGATIPLSPVFKVAFTDFTVIECNGVPATHVGTNGPDAITGTDGNDVIVALGGDDTIDAGKGNDLICAGSGNDVVNGGGGNDTIFGRAGKGSAQRRLRQRPALWRAQRRQDQRRLGERPRRGR